MTIHTNETSPIAYARAAGFFRFGFVADSSMLVSDVAIAVLFYVLLN